MEVQGRKVTFWSRSDISACSCSEKAYRHVHCPCSDCNGRATDRSTELRHWRQASILTDQDAQPAIDSAYMYHCTDSESEVEGEQEMETDSGENVFSEGDEQQMESDFEGSDLGEDLSQQELNEQDANSRDELAAKLTNPMRKFVVTAVLDALKIKRDSGASIGTFEDILEYAKKLLLSSLHNETIDRDILTTLWPKSWNDVQSLLREEGSEDARHYYIFICCQEKVVDGDSGPKYSYTGKYSIMENKDNLCTNCGKKHYLTYYYLGLNGKVKNWFRSKNLCEKMLSH